MSDRHRLQKAYAARVKGIHYINAPPLVDRLMSIVKTVLPPKIADRVSKILSHKYSP